MGTYVRASCLIASVIAVAMIALCVTGSWRPAFAAPPPLTANDDVWLPGMNLAVGEFKRSRSKLWEDYGYPSEGEIDYYQSKGFRVLRIPFLAARFIQPTLTRGATLTDDVDIVEKLVDYAATKDMYVILDMHDYGRIFTVGLIGKDEGATEEFAAAWRLIAERFKDHPNIIFGLMNEPNKQSATEWLAGANAAIAAIRDAGAKQLILVPGSYWTGAHSWMKKDNHEVMLNVQDPGKNFIYEVHQYLDADSIGTSKDVTPGSGSGSLKAFTEWARTHKVKAFLGEFGWADSPEAHKEGEDLVAFMSQNRDVWSGWTYWAGGPWWGNYMFSIEPTDGEDKPQMGVLEKFID